MAAASASSVSSDCGRRPSSMSWISSTSRAVSGVATPASLPSVTTIPSCASTSVRRLRTARSRQMPLCVLADLRLCATRASSDAAAASSGADGRYAEGSNPSNASGVTPRARATARISRASATYRLRYARHRERVGDRFVGERRREEHRAVRFLAPEVAPDVRRDDRAIVEAEPRVVNGGDARGHARRRPHRGRPRRVRRSG